MATGQSRLFVNCKRLSPAESDISSPRAGKGGFGRDADPIPEVYEFDSDLPGLELCGSEIVDLHGEQRVAERDAWSGLLAARPG